jgi:hypothetical protein
MLVSCWALSPAKGARQPSAKPDDHNDFAQSAEPPKGSPAAQRNVAADKVGYVQDAEPLKGAQQPSANPDWSQMGPYIK